MADFSSFFSLSGITYADLTPSLLSGSSYEAGDFSRISSGVKPKDFAYIRVMDQKDTELDTIYFQFMPKMISDSKSATYQDVNIVGRSSPFKSYSNSTARGISFTLDYIASPEMGDDSMTPDIIKTYISRLQALVYPIYDNYVVYPPPRCLIHIGDQLEMVGVCTSVGVSYDAQRIPWTGPYQQGMKTNGVFAFGASIALHFYEVQSPPIGYFERANGQDRANVLAGSEEDSEPTQIDSNYAKTDVDMSNPLFSVAYDDDIQQQKAITELAQRYSNETTTVDYKGISVTIPTPAQMPNSPMPSRAVNPYSYTQIIDYTKPAFGATHPATPLPMSKIYS